MTVFFYEYTPVCFYAKSIRMPSTRIDVYSISLEPKSSYSLART